jgi:hypothetical protein
MNSQAPATPVTPIQVKNAKRPSDPIGFQKATLLGKSLILGTFGFGFLGLFGSLFKMMRYHSCASSGEFLRWQQNKIVIQSTMLTGVSFLMLANGFEAKYRILVRI